jgi:hypothetical protein
MDLQTIEKELLIVAEQLNLLKGGKKASAPRTRESLLKIQKETNRLRKEVLAFVKNMPTKTKAVKVEAVEPEVEEEPAVEEVKVEKKKTQKKLKV